MTDGVKPRRRYDSSRRQEQARENRRAVLEAARRMFLERGYAATTVGAIAAEARVGGEGLQGIREQAGAGDGRRGRGHRGRR